MLPDAPVVRVEDVETCWSVVHGEVTLLLVRPPSTFPRPLPMATLRGATRCQDGPLKPLWHSVSIGCI